MGHTNINNRARRSGWVKRRISRKEKWVGKRTRPSSQWGLLNKSKRTPIGEYVCVQRGDGLDIMATGRASSDHSPWLCVASGRPGSSKKEVQTQERGPEEDMRWGRVRTMKQDTQLTVRSHKSLATTRSWGHLEEKEKDISSNISKGECLRDSRRDSGNCNRPRSRGAIGSRRRADKEAELGNWAPSLAGGRHSGHFIASHAP